MNSLPLSWGRRAFFLLSLLAVCTATAQEEFALRFNRTGSDYELKWQVYWEGTGEPPKFEVQRSLNLADWTVVASDLVPTNGVLSLPVGQDGTLAFYRVKSDQKVTITASGGDEVFGYTKAFKQRLAVLGAISVDTFAAMFPVGATYLDHVDFDVTTANYWKEVNSPPPPWKPTPSGAVILRDFQLTDAEKAFVQKNGFMVSGRLGGINCIGLYYDIFTRDLPVLITSDSILQAWHRSYDALLQDLESMYLTQNLANMLSKMAARISDISQAYGGGPLQQSILDADYFIAVARSLLAGSQVNTVLGQDAFVAQTLAAVASLQTQPINLFGRLEKDPGYVYDFSQFAVRGHYTNSRTLERYFRAMMWCGRTDLRVAGNPDHASPRELGTALVLLQALQDSGQFASWQNIDQVIQVLVGRADSMNFAQLDALMKVSPLKTLADIKSLEDLASIQAQINNGSLGFQEISSDYYFSPMSSAQVVLPRSFTVLGQRFTVDSWALDCSVFDRIIWNNQKVQRRIPSCLDVAFGALANNQVVPMLVARMTNPNGRSFRDGLPYQHNLAAVRQVIDAQAASAWTDNVYNAWLGALRELSPATTSQAYPQCMRTRAWAMKMLNTQLASWTHLRHDNILYVKQSYTEPMTCIYPAGYVEPVPGFWQKMNVLATRMADLLEPIPMVGTVQSEDHYHQGVMFNRDLATVKTGQLTFLRRFAQTMTLLQGMAEKEVRAEPFATNEVDFLKNVVEKFTDYFGNVTYSGWYPKLYYWDAEGFDTQSDALAHTLGLEVSYDSEKWDALVADVHTDAPAPDLGDPGLILHEGVGSVNCLVAVIDSGPDRCVYLGPVLSQYEFEQPPDGRLNDDAWKAKLSAGQTPPPPEWTRNYLLP